MARNVGSYWEMLRNSISFATRKRVFLFSLLIYGITLGIMLSFYYYTLATSESITSMYASLGVTILSIVLGSIALTGFVLSVFKKNPDPFREIMEHKYRILDVMVVVILVAFIVGIAGIVGLGIDLLLGTGVAVYMVMVAVFTLLLLFSYYELLLGKKGIVESIVGSARLVRNNLGRVLVGWIVIIIVVVVLTFVYVLPALLMVGMAVLKGVTANQQLITAIETNQSAMLENVSLTSLIDTSVFTKNIGATIFSILVFWVGSAFTQALQVAYMARLYNSVSKQQTHSKKRK